MRFFLSLILVYAFPYAYSSGPCDKSIELEAWEERKSKILFEDFMAFFKTIPIGLQKELLTFGPGTALDQGRVIKSFMIVALSDNIFVIDKSVTEPAARENQVAMPEFWRGYKVFLYGPYIPH